MAYTAITPIGSTLRAIRASLDLTQQQLADRLGVSFATVNRWEGGVTAPQRAARIAINALADEAGVDTAAATADETEAAAQVTRRRSRRPAIPTTKPMEQMLWDAACSIRGEKDAAKFKDYLLPLLFLKRLSDVFDDEIARLAEEYGDRAAAQEIAESDHKLLPLLPVAGSALGHPQRPRGVRLAARRPGAKHSPARRRRAPDQGGARGRAVQPVAVWRHRPGGLRR